MFKKLIEKIKMVDSVDRAVNEHFAERMKRTQRFVALIATGGFAIMSILNIIQDSDGMLWSTAGSSVICLIGYILGKLLNRKEPVVLSLMLLLIILFPAYTYVGGNDGFACMWIIIVAYLDIYILGLRIGLTINLLYTALLFLAFYGALPGFNAAAYTETFLMRFPVFFLINEVSAVFFIESIRYYQADLIEKQEQLQQLSIMDLNMDVYNRNGYINRTKNFNGAEIRSLAYVYIDANGLHEINNSQGHAMGDKFLRAIADACKRFFPGMDVFRLGGDEFLVIAVDMSKDEVTSDIWQVKAELLKNGWNIAYGIEYRENSFYQEDMLKESNRIMLEDKAAFYSRKSTDRRHNRT